MSEADICKEMDKEKKCPPKQHVDQALTAVERNLLNCIQHDFPLVARPFEKVGKRVGISESRCIEILHRLSDRGILRSIRAVFSWGKVGLSTILIGMRVEADRLDAVAGELNKEEGITHNYSRGGAFNLWCTLIFSDEKEKRQLLERIEKMAGVEDVREFTAEKTYKIGLKLDV